jgi:hypothetical protein
MKVSELKKLLEQQSDDDFVEIFAVNAPPWVTEFGMRITTPDVVQGDDE